MDLIDKIKAVLRTIGLKNPSIDLNYDIQGNVVGHLSDEFFYDKSDSEAQEAIWTALKNNLDPSSELTKVLAIFHETPEERIDRYSGYRTKDVKQSNFWFHKTPDLTTFWLFIDVAKFGDDYKSFFLIINDKADFTKGMTYVYPKDVVEFMELQQNEVYSELFTNTFENAEAEIKMVIMSNYEKLTSQQLWGKANMFYYVYERFEMKPASKQQLIFSNTEIEKIRTSTKNIDQFSIKKEIELALDRSTVLNKMKQSFVY